MDYTRNIDKVCDTGTLSMYNVVLNVQPFPSGEIEPVTLQQAKDWGKIEQDADDDIVTALITAARRICERYSCIGFINRTVTAVINNANGGFFLPYGPVTGTPSATDEFDNAIDIEYRLGQVQTLGQLTITYEAGYAELPDDLMTALKAQFLFMYENRGEGTQSISPVAKMILEPLRMVI